MTPAQRTQLETTRKACAEVLIEFAHYQAMLPPERVHEVAQIREAVARTVHEFNLLRHTCRST